MRERLPGGVRAHACVLHICSIWWARGRGMRSAFVALQGNDVGQERVMTYTDVLTEVCRVVRAAAPPNAAPERSAALTAVQD